MDRNDDLMVVLQFTPVDIIWLLRDQFEKMPEIVELNLNPYNCIIDGETDHFRFILHMYDGGDGMTMISVKYDGESSQYTERFIRKIRHALHIQ